MRLMTFSLSRSWVSTYCFTQVQKYAMSVSSLLLYSPLASFGGLCTNANVHIDLKRPLFPVLKWTVHSVRDCGI